jgi:hypothetical protein
MPSAAYILFIYLLFGQLMMDLEALHIQGVKTNVRGFNGLEYSLK